MNSSTQRILGLFSLIFSPMALAEAEYVTINMEIDVDKPAQEVWQKVGGYCDISVWFNNLQCEIISGDGNVGTVRSLMGGRVTEILIGKTDLSYGYTIPPAEGQFYNLYHGFLEALPVTETTSKLVYTLFYDVSDKETQKEKDEDVARRRTMFEGALVNMKRIAEGDK